jgi:hypothetical protein
MKKVNGRRKALVSPLLAPCNYDAALLLFSGLAALA